MEEGTDRTTTPDSNMTGPADGDFDQGKECESYGMIVARKQSAAAALALLGEAGARVDVLDVRPSLLAEFDVVDESAVAEDDGIAQIDEDDAEHDKQAVCEPPLLPLLDDVQVSTLPFAAAAIAAAAAAANTAATATATTAVAVDYATAACRSTLTRRCRAVRPYC